MLPRVGGAGELDFAGAGMLEAGGAGAVGAGRGASVVAAEAAAVKLEGGSAVPFVRCDGVGAGSMWPFSCGSADGSVSVVVSGCAAEVMAVSVSVVSSDRGIVSACGF